MLKFFENCCNDPQIQQKFTLSLNQLIQNCSQIHTLITLIETLKEQRFQKVQKYIAKSQAKNALSQSKRQTRQYLYLDKLKNQLKSKLDELKHKIKKYEETKTVSDKKDSIEPIQLLIAQAQRHSQQIRLTINKIQKNQLKYYEVGDSIICESIEQEVKGSVDKKMCEEKQREIQIIRSQRSQKPSILPKQNKISDPNINLKSKEKGKNIKEALHKNQIKYIQDTFKESLRDNIYLALTKQDFKYYNQQNGVSYSTEEQQKSLCSFNHSFTPMKSMQEFCSEEWKKMSYLNLVECRINNEMFQVFLKSAKQFPLLKMLWISKYFNKAADNPISIEEIEELIKFYDFQSLEFVYFELRPEEITEERKQDLRNMLIRENKRRNRYLSIYI